MDINNFFMRFFVSPSKNSRVIYPPPQKKKRCIKHQKTTIYLDIAKMATTKFYMQTNKPSKTWLIYINMSYRIRNYIIKFTSFTCQLHQVSLVQRLICWIRGTDIRNAAFALTLEGGYKDCGDKIVQPTNKNEHIR